ncbi:MAG: RNA-binding protein [Deltaproteobacteria bacterium]|nr:RNA-binding protein [Deltaproteobacteria bacterium]
MSAKLFVGSLNFSTTREQLLELFAAAGTVVDVVLPTDRDSGRPRGFAFVEYATPAEAQEAIRRFNGYELDGRALRVNEAEARPPRPRNFGPDAPGDRQGGFGNPFGGGKPFKAKGSRRHLRARKRGG